MNSIHLHAHAKINLYLDVLGKRPDGYHNLETVFQSISLYDEVTIHRRGEGIRVFCNHPDVPTEASNTVVRAAHHLLQTAGIGEDLEIRIDKNIPVAAGLAGGSADAAAVLVGLNELLDLRYPIEKLMQIGVKVGADIPFCLLGGTAIGRGIGDELQPLPPIGNVSFMIANPGFPVSTAWAFRQLNFRLTNSPKNVTILTQNLNKRDWVRVGRSLYNVFEQVVVPQYPVIRELLERLRSLGAVGSLMTGTGPTVFGWMPDRDVAEKAVHDLSVAYGVVTEGCGQGIQII